MPTHLHISRQQRRLIPVALGFLTLLLLRLENASDEWIPEVAVFAATLLALHRARRTTADVPEQHKRDDAV